MRHLSNLNIFHWAVMALSPLPHVCVSGCVCMLVPASLGVHLNVNHISRSVGMRTRVLGKA